MHKDFFGAPLHEGQRIAFARPHYRELTHGVVVSFTPQKVRVAYDQHYASSTVEHTDTQGKKWNHLFLTDPKDVVVDPNYS